MIRINIVKYIATILTITGLILFSIVFLLSCTAGVNIEEANKVLTSFIIKWPAGFDYQCGSRYEIQDVKIKALDQVEELYKWNQI